MPRPKQKNPIPTPIVDAYFKNLRARLNMTHEDEKAEDAERSNEEQRTSLLQELRKKPRAVVRAAARTGICVKAARRAERAGDVESAHAHLRDLERAITAFLKLLYESSREEV